MRFPQTLSLLLLSLGLPVSAQPPPPSPEAISTNNAPVFVPPPSSANESLVVPPGSSPVRPDNLILRGRVVVEQKGGEGDVRRNRGSIVLWLTRTSSGSSAVEGGMTSRPLDPVSGVKIEQKNKAFVPKIAVVTVGSTVDFPSNDTIFHNVFSPSKTKPFDLGLYKTPNSKTVTFDKPGLVEIFCNIHQDMMAWLWVLDTPYFAITSADGSFEILNIPMGRYSLHGWHERAPKLFDQELEINASTPELEITMTDDPDLANKKHPRKDGSPYRNTSYDADEAPAGY